MKGITITLKDRFDNPKGLIKGDLAIKFYTDLTLQDESFELVGKVNLEDGKKATKFIVKEDQHIGIGIKANLGFEIIMFADKKDIIYVTKD